MKIFARLSTIPPYAKFTSNCLNLCEKLAPLVVPATAATAAAAAGAPAVGLMSLIAALGAVGVVLNELFLDVSQNREIGEIKGSLDEIKSRVVTTSNMVALNAKDLAELKAFLAERGEQPGEDVDPKFKILAQVIANSPDIAEELIANLKAIRKEDVVEGEDGQRLLKQTAEALETLAKGAGTSEAVRASILPDVKAIKRDLREVSLMLKGIVAILSVVLVGILVTAGLTYLTKEGQKEIAGEIHRQSWFHRDQFENHEVTIKAQQQTIETQTEAIDRLQKEVTETSKVILDLAHRFKGEEDTQKTSGITSPPTDTLARPFSSPEAKKAFEDYTFHDGNGNVAERFAATTRLIALDPLDPRSWFYHGFSAFEKAAPSTGNPDLGLMRTARDAGTKAIQLIHDRQLDRNLLSNAHTNLGAAYFYLGEGPAAEENHRKAIAVDPANALAYANLDSALSTHFPNRLTDRLEVLRQGIKASGKSTSLADRLVNALAERFDAELAKGNKDSALQALDEIASLQGENTGLLIAKWSVFLVENEVDRMRETITKALELSQTTVDRVECLLLSYWTEQISGPKTDLAEDPKFVAIKSTLDGIDRSTLGDPSVVDLLNVLYFTLDGDLTAAETSASKIPEGTENSSRAAAIMLPMRMALKQRQMEEMAEMGLPDEEYAKRLKQGLQGMFDEATITIEKSHPELTAELKPLFAAFIESALGGEIRQLLNSAENFKITYPEGPGYGMGCYMAALAHSLEGNSSESVSEFRKAFDSYPLLRDAALEDFSRQLLLSGNAEECVDVLKKASERSGISIRRSLILYNALVSLGRVDEAFMEAKRLREAFPDEDSAKNLLGMGLIMMAESLINQWIQSGNHDDTDLLTEANRHLVEACELDAAAGALAYQVRSLTLNFLVNQRPTDWIEPAKEFLMSTGLSQSGAETTGLVSGLRATVLLREVDSPKGSEEYKRTLEQARGFLRNAVKSPHALLDWWEELLQITAELDPISEAIDLVVDFSSFGSNQGWSQESIADSKAFYAGSLIGLTQMMGSHLSTEDLSRLIGLMQAGLNAVEDPSREAEFQSNIGLAYHLKGDAAASGNAHGEAVRLDPRRWGDWNNYSDRLLRQMRFREALVAAIHSLKSFPWKDASLYRGLLPVLGNLLFSSSIVTVPLLVVFLGMARWRKGRRAKIAAT